MVQDQIKLRPCLSQEKQYDQWLFHLSSAHDWAVRKIEVNAKNKIFFSKQEFQYMLADHGPRLGIPSHTLQGVLCKVHDAWKRCFNQLAGKPRLKGMRNKLTSISFPDPIKAPKRNRITLPGIGSVRFHRQELPTGKAKCGRLVKRATGDAEPKAIGRTAFGEMGIDPGFSNLLTTSDRMLAARAQERIADRKQDRNHQLTRRLVAENVVIVWSKDTIKGVAKKFGKSVVNSSHAQTRSMLAYKSAPSGTQFIEVASRNPTRTCSACGHLSGPSGGAGLSVGYWSCPCGAEHDRDMNAAVNTLTTAAGYAVEMAYD